jgi:hypothetical protein
MRQGKLAVAEDRRGLVNPETVPAIVPGGIRLLDLLTE